MPLPSPSPVSRVRSPLGLLVVLVALLPGCAKKPTPPANPPAAPAVQTPAAEAPGVTVVASATRPWEAVAPRHLLTGHRDAVLTVAFSPTGSHVASGGADGATWLWDLTSGKGVLLHHSDGHAVFGVAFSANGKTVVAGDSGGSVHLWEVAGTRRVGCIAVGAPVAAVALTADGARVWTAVLGGVPGAGVRCWDAATGREQGVAIDRQGLLAAAFTPDARQVALTGPRGGEWIDLASGRVNASFRGGHLLRLAPSGDQLLGCTIDRTMELWTAAGKRGTFAPAGEQLLTPALSHDGRRGLSGGASGKIDLWDVDRPEAAIRRLSGHTGAVRALAFSADGRRAVSGGDDRTVRVWNLDEGSEMVCLGEVHEWEVWTIDRRWVLVRGYPLVRVLWLWDVVERREVWRLEGHGARVVEMALALDGKQAASVDEDGTLHVWDLTTGKVKSRLVTRLTKVRKILFSADGRFVLAAAADRTLVLCDAASGTELRRFAGPDLPLTAFATAEDLGRLALTSERIVLVWSTTGGELGRLTSPVGAVAGVALAPDGRHLLATTAVGGEQLWEVDSGRELAATETDTSWLTRTRQVLVRHTLVPAAATTTTVRIPGPAAATTVVRAPEVPVGDNPVVSGTVTRLVQGLIPGTPPPAGTTTTVPVPGTTRTTTVAGAGVPFSRPGVTPESTFVPGQTTTVPGTTTTFVPRSTTTYVPRTTFVPGPTTTMPRSSGVRYTTRTIIIRRR